MRGKNLRTEPKHIVFLSQLLLLFGFCHSCKTDNPTVDVNQVGTEAVVTTSCSNPKCEKPNNTWHSQPFIPGTKLPAGNLLLCMAILVAGGSASKVLTIFSHMGLSCLSLNTFFKYQRVREYLELVDACRHITLILKTTEFRLLYISLCFSKIIYISLTFAHPTKPK